ncbi:interferon-inducible GTPase 5-like, partial [Paramuricea clavata]
MSMDNSWEKVFIEDVKGKLSDSQGNLQDEIKELLQARLTQWKDVEVKFGVTGDSGAGKSSFINAIRGLADDEEGAAKTGVKETTRDIAMYSHPTNPKIKFWDLPGI